MWWCQVRKSSPLLHIRTSIPQNSLPLLLTRSRAIFSSFQGEREAVRVGERDDTNLYKRVEEEGEEEEEEEAEKEEGKAWAHSGRELIWIFIEKQLCLTKVAVWRWALAEKKSIASVFQTVGLANNWSILIRSYVGHTNVMEQWR